MVAVSLEGEFSIDFTSLVLLLALPLVELSLPLFTRVFSLAVSSVAVVVGYCRVDVGIGASSSVLTSSVVNGGAVANSGGVCAGVSGDGFVTLSSAVEDVVAAAVEATSSSSSCTRTGRYCFRLDIFDFIANLFVRLSYLFI